METFSYHCPACGSELKLNVFSQRLMCASCGRDYNPATLKSDEHITIPGGAEQPGAEQEKIVRDFVEMNLYRCGSCGAEVVTNDVEVTKFCSFCGNSAIIYDRVTQIDRPDLIIPFRISKEQALDALKEKYSKAKYLPPEFQNLNIDSVYAIYVPYYVYDADMVASGHIRVPVSHNKSTTIETRTFGGRMRRRVFFDSSRKLNDSVSIYLNPYPYDKAVEFDPAYLSGFYADIADVESDQVSKRLKNYIWEILSDDCMDQVPEMRGRQSRQTNTAMYSAVLGKGNEPVYVPILDQSTLDILDVESVLCPVYFVTFKTSSGLANILVNGCTGKVVGSIPADEALVDKAIKRNCIIGALIACPIFALVMATMPLLWSAMLALILIFSAVTSGRAAKKRYNEINEQMNTNSMFKLRRN